MLSSEYLDRLLKEGHGLKHRVSAGASGKPWAIGNLEDMAYTAAYWWVHRMTIGARRYKHRINSTDALIERFRVELARVIRERLALDAASDAGVWLICHDEGQYPLFQRVASQCELSAVQWGSGYAMWLSIRKGIGLIEVRTAKHPIIRPLYRKEIDLSQAVSYR